jgi:hypothetical protein
VNPLLFILVVYEMGAGLTALALAIDNVVQAIRYARACLDAARIGLPAPAKRKRLWMQETRAVVMWPLFLWRPWPVTSDDDVWL